MRSAAPSSSSYIAPLTGLRAIAAGLVVFFHYFLSANVYQYAEIPFVSWLMGNGQHGVSVFFALSGFLITLRYRNAFAAGKIRFRDYWLRRLIRIYPVYVVTLTVFAIIPALAKGQPEYANPLVWPGLYGMAQALFRPLFALGIPIGWSLTLEEIFYLLAPRLGGFMDGRPNTNIAGIALRGAAIIAASAGLFALTFLSGMGQKISGYTDEFMFIVSFFARLPEFAAGMVCAIILLRHRQTAQRNARWLVWMGTLGCIGFMLAANQFMAEKQFALNAIARFVAAAFSAVLMLGLTCAPTGTAISKALGSPVMDYLGKTSYSLYLVHLTWPVTTIWGALLSLPLHPLTAVPIMYLVSVAASIALYELVEHPAHAWLSKKLKGSGD